jgi:glucose-6-phosphate 1-dehydrogenase
MAKISPGVGPRFPQVVVLFGATGDLARRKLLPGLFHLASAGFIPGCRVIAVALDDITLDDFRRIAREALEEFSSRPISTICRWPQVPRRSRSRLNAPNKASKLNASGCTI